MRRPGNTRQLDALIEWFADHDRVTLADAQHGFPDPADPENLPRIRVERVAPLIHELRNAGWVITTGKDLTGKAFYEVQGKPGETPRNLTVSPLRAEAQAERAKVGWRCTKDGCISMVIPDAATALDARYHTGRCLTHGKVVIVFVR
jgi:hypothetical protein